MEVGEKESPKMAKDFFAALPHAVALGLVSERIEGGCAVMSMPWAEKLVGDPATVWCMAGLSAR